MSSIIEKLDSYQIITNLFPGAFFCIALEYILGISIPVVNPVEDILSYYFVGLILNRIGSLVVKPILIRMRFIVEAPYSDYVCAAKKDRKIDVLSEMNNYFRTLLTASLLLFGMYVVMNNEQMRTWISGNWKGGILIGLINIFLFSFRKQTDFVRRRVEKNMDISDNQCSESPNNR